MKKIVVVLLAFVMLSAYPAYTAISFAETVYPENVLDIVTSNKELDGKVIHSDKNQKIGLNMIESDNLQTSEFCNNSSIMIDSCTIDCESVVDELSLSYRNNAIIYLYGKNYSDIVSCANSILKSNDKDFNVSLNLEEEDGFIGCSLYKNNNDKTVITYCFSDKESEEEQIASMMRAPNWKFSHKLWTGDGGSGAIDINDQSEYADTDCIIFHKDKEEMQVQSIYYFTRLGATDSETLWDINNVVNVNPAYGYQTKSVTCSLDVKAIDGEKLIGFGPSATVNSSSASYTVTGSISKNGVTVGGNVSYSVSLADIQCKPTYIPSYGECSWVYEYTEGSTAAQSATVLSSTVRVSNYYDDITIYPNLECVFSKYEPGSNCDNRVIEVLLLEERMSELKISHTDII